LDSDKSKNWLRKNLCAILNRLGCAGEDPLCYPWHELSIERLSELRPAFLSEGKSAGTINSYFNALRRVLEFALIEGKIGDRHFALVKLILKSAKNNAKHQKEKELSSLDDFDFDVFQSGYEKHVKDEDVEIDGVNRKDVSRLFRSIGKKSVIAKRNSCVLALMVYAGLRREEVSTLTFGDINLKKNTLSIVGKGAKMREIPIHLVLLAFLRLWIPVVKCQDGKINKASTVIRSVTRMGKVLSKGLTVDATYKVIKRIGSDEGMVDVHPHTFRKFFATDMLDQGVDYATVGKYLGHESLNTTKIYDKRGLEIGRDAINTIMVA